LPNPCPQIGPPRSVAEHPVLNLFLIEDLLKEVRRAILVARRIGGVDPQIFPLPLYRQVGILFETFRGNAPRCQPRGSSLAPAERGNSHKGEA